MLYSRFYLMKREFYRIASPTAADSLPQVPSLERLRHGLPKHGAIVDGGQPEGELKDNAFRLFTPFSHGREFWLCLLTTGNQVRVVRRLRERYRFSSKFHSTSYLKQLNGKRTGDSNRWSKSKASKGLNKCSKE